MSQPIVPPIPTPRKRKSRAKLWIILGAILALVVVLVVVTKAKAGSQQATLVTVEKAQVRTITQLVTATGKVQPETEVRISSEVAGELIDIPVLEGQVVKKGQVLARIKADFYQAQVDQAEATLVATRAASVLSKARLVKAQSDFKQANQLWDKQLISEAEYVAAKSSLDVAQADFDSSLAQIRRTEGSLSQATDQISKTTVFAPMEKRVESHLRPRPQARSYSPSPRWRIFAPKVPGGPPGMRAGSASRSGCPRRPSKFTSR